MKKWSYNGRIDGPRGAAHYADVGGFGIGSNLGDLNQVIFARDPWGDGVMVVFSPSEKAPGDYYPGTDFYAILD